MWTAKLTLLAPTLLGKGPGFWARRLSYPELAEVARSRQPALDPYAKLCDTYHDYAVGKLADYTGFLVQLAKKDKVELRSVLDVACGAGTTSERLAKVFPEVVGIDASAAMLAQARLRCPGARFVQCDFCDFALDQQFDAAVSVTNSLNYVADMGQFRAVLHNVAAHLKPGGWFVFDTMTERGMRLLSGLIRHVDVGGTRFALQFRYFPERRQEEVDIVFATGIETHRRVPIDPADVRAAAEGTGLQLIDYFGAPFLPGKWYSGAMCYFVLRKTSE